MIVKVLNQTLYPTAEIEELLKIAGEGIDPGAVVVRVKDCRGPFTGRAYRAFMASEWWPTGVRYVLLRVGPKCKFPWTRRYQYKRLKTAPPRYRFATWQEAIVGVGAHELTHIEQFRTQRPASEVEAEWALVRALERYRSTAISQSEVK